LLIVLILSACGSASSGEGAAQAIETYLTALVEKDAATLVNTSCATWEEGALTDSRAYDGVTARLEGMACAVDSSDGEYTLVSCSGNIIATYSGEDRPLPLDTRQYLAVEEGGEWRMCGYR
jgi:hypothetical protein